MKKIALILAPLALVTGMAFAQTAAPATPAKPAKLAATMTACTIAPLNVNTATAADLAKVPGLDAKLADLVVKDRPYKDQAELVKKVKGIGNKNILKFGACFLYK